MNRLRLSTLSLTLAIAVMTLGYANPSFADKPIGGVHGHGDEALYSVEISGDMTGKSDDDHDWRGNFGGKKAIGLNDASLTDRPGIGEFTDLSFFSALEDPPAFDAEDGAVCFPAGGSFAIHEGSVSQGRGGRAESRFFFHGFTNDGNVTVLYQLQLIGEFASGSEWPPTGMTDLNMTTWVLSATNEGQEIKSISCIGEGATNVTIMVINESIRT